MNKSNKPTSLMAFDDFFSRDHERRREKINLYVKTLITKLINLDFLTHIFY